MATTKPKRIKQRSEPVNMTEGTDFGVNSQRVNVNELLDALKDQKAHAELKKEAKFDKKQHRVLPVPLSKTEEEKIKRAVEYNHISKDISKWNNTIHQNRLADRIDFPLQNSSIKMQTAMETTQKFTPKTSLELKIASLLEGSKNVIRDDRMLTKAEEEALKAMDLEEAMQRRNEIQKMRALQSYMEAKAHRRNKIKSKQYHRILKKERLKQERKEFESMQNDPNVASEMVEKMDKERILERMTLKHRGTGKWAKQLQSRAKYDKNARSSLAEQLQINRQLVKKVKSDSEDEEEEKDKDLVDGNEVKEEEESPWLSYKKKEESDEDEKEKLENAIDGYKKVWNEVREEIEKKKNVEKKVKPKKVKNEVKKLEKDAQELVKQTIKRLKRGLQDDDEVEKEKNAKRKKRAKPGKTEKMDPSDEKVDEFKANVEEVAKNKQENIETDFEKMDREVNLQDFSLNGASELILKGDGDGEQSSEDEDDEHRMTLAEAFADDDVTSAFREEKEAAIKRDQPEAIDLFLPGWGSWAGAGIKENKKLKSKFTIEVPKLKRKDDNMGNLILNEDKDKKFAKFQVDKVPFPFTNAHYFEKSMQVPLGKDWNTENGFRKLIQPKLVTKLGAIVEPIDKDALSNTKQKTECKSKSNKKKT